MNLRASDGENMVELIQGCLEDMEEVLAIGDEVSLGVLKTQIFFPYMEELSEEAKRTSTPELARKHSRLMSDYNLRIVGGMVA